MTADLHPLARGREARAPELVGADHLRPLVERARARDRRPRDGERVVGEVRPDLRDARDRREPADVAGRDDEREPVGDEPVALDDLQRSGSPCAGCASARAWAAAMRRPSAGSRAEVSERRASSDGAFRVTITSVVGTGARGDAAARERDGGRSRRAEEERGVSECG